MFSQGGFLMSGILADVAEAMQIVLTSTAEAAACNSGFVQRRSKLTGPAFVQTLTFGWLSNPEATLEDLAQTASTVGVSISPILWLANGLVASRKRPRAGQRV